MLLVLLKTDNGMIDHNEIVIDNDDDSLDA